MGHLKDILKDKNKILMLVPILLGVLFVIVFFGKKDNTSELTEEEINHAFLEPDAEDERKVTDKVDAYKREQEEAARKKREEKGSIVKGSDFYFEMQSSDDEYSEKMKERIEKMKKDPLNEVTGEYKGQDQNSNSAFSDKMRQQLNDIEDQETFNQIVKEAQKEERIRKELEENAKFRDEMRKKYQAQSSEEKPQENTSTVNVDSVPVPEVEQTKPTFIVENGKRRRRSQFTLDNKVNLIKAAIYGDQTIVSGSAVRMRLLEPLWVGGVEIPANTIFTEMRLLGLAV